MANAAATLSSASCLVTKPVAQWASCSVRHVAGLPAFPRVQVRCSVQTEQKAGVPAVVAATSLAASALAVAQPALALVDERLSTEGTGLSLGVSNPLIIWILLGIFGLIWALFFTYASGLKEDDDSGLAL